MTGARSRSKGARGERDVCAKLERELGIKFSRNLKQYQQAQHGDIEPPCGPYLIEQKDGYIIPNKANLQKIELIAEQIRTTLL